MKPSPLKLLMLALGCVAILVVFYLSLSQARSSRSDLIVYGGFGGGGLDPAKWRESISLFQSTRVPPKITVKDGWLTLGMESIGSSNVSTGSGANHVRVGAAQSLRAIRRIQATMRIDSFRLTPCADNPVSSMIRATVGGFFFSSRSNDSPSIVGDIFAVIGLARSSDSKALDPGRFELKAIVLQCGDPCTLRAEHSPPGATLSTVLFEEVLGHAGVGDSLDLGVEWRRKESAFTFFRGDQRVAEYVYSGPQLGRSYAHRKHLDIGSFIPYCATGLSEGALEASFSNVRIKRR